MVDKNSSELPVAEAELLAGHKQESFLNIPESVHKKLNTLATLINKHQDDIEEYEMLSGLMQSLVDETARDYELSKDDRAKLTENLLEIAVHPLEIDDTAAVSIKKAKFSDSEVIEKSPEAEDRITEIRSQHAEILALIAEINDLDAQIAAKTEKDTTAYHAWKTVDAESGDGNEGMDKEQSESSLSSKGTSKQVGPSITIPASKFKKPNSQEKTALTPEDMLVSEPYEKGSRAEKRRKGLGKRAVGAGAGIAIAFTSLFGSVSSASKAEALPGRPAVSTTIDNNAQDLGVFRMQEVADSNADGAASQAEAARAAQMEQEKQDFEVHYYAYDQGKTHQYDMGPAYVGENTKEAISADMLNRAAHDPNLLATLTTGCGVREGDTAAMNKCASEYAADREAAETAHQQLQEFFAKSSVTMEVVEVTGPYDALWANTYSKQQGERPDIVLATNVNNGGHAVLIHDDGKLVAEYRLECGFQWMMQKEVVEQMQSVQSDVSIVTSEEVQTPIIPENPAIVPEVPPIPVVPEVPTDTPVTPDTPETPDTPDTPDTPETPDTPITPPEQPLEAKNPTEDINVNPDVAPQKQMGDVRVSEGELKVATPPPQTYTPPEQHSTSSETVIDATKGESTTTPDNSAHHEASGDLQISHDTAVSNATKATGDPKSPTNIPPVPIDGMVEYPGSGN